MKPFTRMFSRLLSPGKPEPERAPLPPPPPIPAPRAAEPPPVSSVPMPTESRAHGDEARLTEAPMPQPMADPVLAQPALAGFETAEPEPDAEPDLALDEAAHVAPEAEALATVPSSEEAMPSITESVDWKLITPVAPGAGAAKRKEPSVALPGLDLTTALLDVTAASLAAGMMAASGRRHSAEDAIALMNQVRAAMQPARPVSAKIV